MQAIGSVKEDLKIEKRISIIPETVKKLVEINFSVFVEKDYAAHLGISDEEYKNNGASILNSAREVFYIQMLVPNVDALIPEEGDGVILSAKAIEHCDYRS